MEAYFSDDARLKEWVDEIVEKLITVCLLQGQEADLEFARGQQAVQKIALALYEISELPPSVLSDGLRQILEQRLPDARVIENFPTFNEVMNRMIQEGIIQALPDHPNVVLESIPAIPASVQVVGDLIPGELPLPGKVRTSEIEDLTTRPSCEPQVEIEPSRGSLRKSLVPFEAKVLSFVLREMYPNAGIKWNLNLGKHSFLAQVNNILVYVIKDHTADEVNLEMAREGWRVLALNQEDLSCRHRLERLLRGIGKGAQPHNPTINKNTLI